MSGRGAACACAGGGCAEGERWRADRRRRRRGAGSGGWCARACTRWRAGRLAGGVGWGGVGRRACMALCLCRHRWLSVGAFSSVVSSVCVCGCECICGCVCSVAVCDVARFSSVVTRLVCVCVCVCGLCRMCVGLGCVCTSAECERHACVAVRVCARGLDEDGGRRPGGGRMGRVAEERFVL